MVALLLNFLALLFSFFVAGVLVGALFYKPLREAVKRVFTKVRRDIWFAKVAHNPILSPGKHPWTAEAVMNPAALRLNNRTHLLFRAIGMDGVSRLGYASSGNGIVFDERLPYPVFAAMNPRKLPMHARRYSPVLYPSGGSWGGVEDPRMVAIEGRVYVTFNMFDGWDFIRVAVISIDEKDFLAKRFDKWSRPTFLSPPGQIHKNWVLFPEKINGKFAILHSVSPKVEVAYRDRLEDVGGTEPFIQSWVGPRDSIAPRANGWDSFMRSAGPPPIKTDKGWLLFYHAIDKRDPHRYKLGAMLLAHDRPTHVLHRSPDPILMPDEHYENAGKPGIVYACGAVRDDGMLYIYYGGADKVVCVAFAPLESFLSVLIEGSQAALSAEPTQTA